MDLNPDEFVLVTTMYDANEAHFVTGLLESHGIKTVADSRPVGQLMGFGEDLIPDIKIYVQRGDLKDANAILNYQEPATDEDFKWRRDRARQERMHDKKLGIAYLLIFAFVFYIWHSFTPKTEGQQLFRHLLLGFSIVPAYIAFMYFNREG